MPCFSLDLTLVKVKRVVQIIYLHCHMITMGALVFNNYNHTMYLNLTMASDDYEYFMTTYVMWLYKGL